jgi:hypothetical protein
MKMFPACLLGIFCIATGTGCCSTAPAHHAEALGPAAQTGGTTNASVESVWHSETMEPLPGTKPVRWYNRINVLWWFGNRDEPTPPDWYHPNCKLRTLLWYVRNPMKNFTWYVVGIADKTTIRSGKYPRRITKPEGGWNFAVSSCKWIRLPFISYCHKSFVTYIGWRERGNFGMAFRFNHENEKNRTDSE